MKYSRVVCLLALTCLSVPCFAHHMALVVNKDNNVGDISSAHLAKIFRLEVKKWHDGKDVVLILHADSEGERNTLQRLGHISSGELKSFIAAHPDSVKIVASDAEVLKLVQDTPGAVGLVDVRSITDQINVVRVDNKLPMEAGYLPH